MKISREAADRLVISEQDIIGRTAQRFTGLVILEAGSTTLTISAIVTVGAAVVA